MRLRLRVGRALGPAVVSLSLFSPTLGPGPLSIARADHVDEASAKVFELEGRIGELEKRLKPPEDEKGALAERRLVDAQVAYELKNYEAASIILYDIIEKYPTSSVYDEALYYLADSLYLKRDFFSSRRYFERLVERGPSAPKYQEALERLVELSLHTGDYDPVDGYLQKLAAMQSANALASIPYVAGKYRYFRRQFEEAIATLSTMTPANKYYLHGLYFIGASHVALGRDHLPQAMAAFDAIIKAIPVPGAAPLKPGEKEPPKPAWAQLGDAEDLVIELAHLGRARILLDQNKFPEALAEYAQIRSASPNFNDSLYESAWVSIKSKDYQKAERELDLLILNAPDSPLAPEVRLLTGNLDIRQAQYGKATASFIKTRDDYEPLSKELKEAIQGDSAGYFRDAITKNLEKFDLARIVPKAAVKWMKDEPDTEKVRELLTDESDLGGSLTDAEDTIRRLERAINGQGRVNVFPELARAKTKGVEISNALVEQKHVLGEKQRQLMEPVAGPEAAQLEGIHKQREQLETQLRQLPTADESIAARQKKARDAFNEIDKRASEVQVQLLGARAQVAATNKYYHDAVEKTLPEGQQKAAQVEIDQHSTELDREQAEIDALRKELEDASQSVGVDDADMRAAEQVKAQYDELIKRQSVLVQQLLARMSPTDRAKAEQIEQVLQRANGIEQRLTAYNRRIEDLTDEKLVPIRATIDEEKGRVGGYRTTLASDTGESAEAGGGVLANALRDVSQRFYNVVVRADVGIIDVAWALKDSATKENNRLISERKRELKILDDEFRDILKENQ